MDDLDDVEVARLTTMASGALITQMVSAAASLGLADAMGLDTATTGQLAQRCGAEESSLGRLLRGLASLGVVEELTPKSFALTDMGHLLRSDHPRSLRSWCVVHGELLAPLWGGLLDAVRSGRPAAAEVFGQPFYAHLAAHPALNDDWNRAMAETARAWWASGDLLDVVDWSTVSRTVIDVGGGQGGLLAVVLQRHPHLRGVVYDLPDAVAGAPALLAAAKVADRAEAVAGDFFESVPAGGDVYLLCRVVFNWDDEQALRVLGACRRAMSDEALLLVIDQVVPDEDHAHGAKVNDVSLLTMGGRARTAGEWAELIEKARLSAVQPITSTIDTAWTATVLRRG